MKRGSGVGACTYSLHCINNGKDLTSMGVVAVSRGKSGAGTVYRVDFGDAWETLEGTEPRKAKIKSKRPG